MLHQPSIHFKKDNVKTWVRGVQSGNGSRRDWSDSTWKRFGLQSCSRKVVRWFLSTDSASRGCSRGWEDNLCLGVLQEMGQRWVKTRVLTGHSSETEGQAGTRGKVPQRSLLPSWWDTSWCHCRRTNQQLRWGGPNSSRRFRWAPRASAKWTVRVPGPDSQSSPPTSYSPHNYSALG